MPASRKKLSRGLQLDEVFLESAPERGGFWTDETPDARPLSSRSDIEDFSSVSARPANDAGRRPRAVRSQAPTFAGSSCFWKALIATVIVCLMFAAVTGAASGTFLAAMLSNPSQYAAFWASLAVTAAIPWAFALAAYRQAVSNDILRGVMLATQRLHEPSSLAEEAGHRINASFDQLFADIDARMAVLDRKGAQLSNHLAATMRQSTEAADVNINNMRNIVEASETQREALQRTGMMISTEILPVIAKLETTLLSLGDVSQTAGGILETVASRLQQTTQELKFCLDGFNNANHTIAPEIEKRMLRFEASIARLPEQLDATIGRLSPMSETIADAAMLSTANVEVIDQLGKDIASALDNSRALFTDVSASTTALLQEAVDAQVTCFRDMLKTAIAEEAARVSGLSYELSQLADTAVAVVDRLQQPVADVTAATDKALANANESINLLDQRIGANLKGCVAELNDVAARLVSSVNREMEVATVSLQTRLAASSTDLMQRVSADTARFENLIGETAERTSSRVALAIKDLPSVLAQRMETEVAKIDGSLKGSIFGLSDQIRTMIDTIPNRLTSMTRETLLSLESSLERSFDGVAQRSELLSEQFRKQATETTEAVLQDYVDFIFLAVDRFRKELEEVNGSFSRSLEQSLGPLPQGQPNRLAAQVLPPDDQGT